MTADPGASDPDETLMLRDCHAHTTFSDGALEPRAAVAAARARGVRPGIADHVSRDISRGVSDPAAVIRYLDALEALDEPDLARGAEFCWHDDLWRELPASTMARFTHRIGSLHAIFLPDRTRVHMFQRQLPADLDRDRYMDAHVAELERFAATMPVDILAHPTLLPIPLRPIPLEELWTEAREERAVEALARAGICFEVSARYRPHERFVQRAHAHGVRISLGSDGHLREQVGHLAWPLEVVTRLGIPRASLYDPLVHGSRPIAEAART